MLHGGRKRFVRWRFEGVDAGAGCRQPGVLPPLGWFGCRPGWRRAATWPASAG